MLSMRHTVCRNNVLEISTMTPLVQRRAVLLRDSINQTLDILAIGDVGIMARRLHRLMLV